MVDGLDRRIGIGVGGQQHALAIWVVCLRPFEKLDAAHLRHPLIHQEKGNWLIALLKLPHRLERLRASFGLHDAKAAAVFVTQVARHTPQDASVVVHRDQYRFYHRSHTSR